MDIILKEKAKQIKEILKIKDVVSFYSNAEFNNKNKCCCPLPNHEEKTPSFTLNLKKNTFKCFGCGEGGDLISFVQKMFNLNFDKSIEKLINDFNLKLEIQNMTYEEVKIIQQQENKKKYEQNVLNEKIDKISDSIVSKLRFLRKENYSLYSRYKNTQNNGNLKIGYKIRMEQLRNEIGKYEEIYLILNGLKSNDIKLSKDELLNKIESGTIKI